MITGRQIAVLLGLLVILALAGCSTEPTNPIQDAQGSLEEGGGSGKPTHEIAAWWDDQQQGARNQSIINRGQQDRGRYVRQSCKVWVQTVVSSATRGVVAVPQNLDNWRWRNGNRVRIVFQNADANRRAGSFTVSPGHIIQSELRASPWLHTQIVTSVSRDGFGVIDANRERYVAGRDTGYVATRSWTWAQWRAFAGRFTVYEIR